MIPLARPTIGAEEQEAVAAVLASGQLAQGPEVAAFETEFADLVDGRTCVAVNSGTSALHLALLALGIGPGDEVIVPSFTFAATANAVRLAGAEPVFADIEPATFALDPAAAAAAVGPRTAAIMAVHLYGHPADMPALLDVARRHGLAVVEDAAQAHRASRNRVPAGAMGDAAAFSFYPTKNMTTGEGGMVVLADPAAARTVRLLRNQGMEQRYANEIVGFNLRLTDIAAAIGRAQLRRLPGLDEARRANAAALLGGLAGVDRVTIPAVGDGVEHAWHQFTLRVPDRDAFAAALADAGVASGVYYPTPVHRLPPFGLELDLPETARAAAEVLSIPVGPHLQPGDTDRIVAAVAAVATGVVGSGPRVVAG